MLAPLLLSGLLLAQSPVETFRYRFDAATELADFEAVAGTWTVSAGNLWCTSKGAREELKWRRDLTASGTASVKLVGAGKVAFALRGGRQETLVRLDRGDARVVVETDGKLVLERPFEPPVSGPIALAIAWSAERIEVRVGDDEAIQAPRAPAAAPFAQLALLSLKSQPRFDDLVIGRGALPAPSDGDPNEPAPTEDQRLALERAAQLLDGPGGGDPDAAFELLVKSLPPADGNAPRKLPEPVLLLLEQLAARRPALRSKPPLKELIAARTVAARDGSAALVLPLRPGWTVEALEIRRVEGMVFTLACPAPRLAIEIYRYDQKLKYPFGRDPKGVLVSGGGGPTLGRARADDQQDLHPKSEFARPFEPSKFEFDGAAYEYELVWTDPAEPSQPRALRELFALHRGDTWRITIEGSPLAFDRARADLDWLLAGFRFTKS